MSTQYTIPSGVPLVIATAVVLGSASQVAAMELARDGRANAVIVLSRDPSPAARTGANLLRDVVQRMSGADLEIRSDEGFRVIGGSPRVVVPDSMKVESVVLVGKSDLTDALGRTGEGLGPGGMWMESVKKFFG